jgi:hypothetical protein
VSINPKVAQAIKDAVSEAKQPADVSKQISAWMLAIISGNEDPGDQVAASRRLENLLDVIKVATPAQRNGG